jgi:hypothetical protein
MRHHGGLWTTLELDDDLLKVARQLAAQRGTTMGRVISELVRKALAPKATPKVSNGASLFVPKAEAKLPHLALVNKLWDEA